MKLNVVIYFKLFFEAILFVALSIVSLESFTDVF